MFSYVFESLFTSLSLQIIHVFNLQISFHTLRNDYLQLSDCLMEEGNPYKIFGSFGWFVKNTTWWHFRYFTLILKCICQNKTSHWLLQKGIGYTCEKSIRNGKLQKNDVYFLLDYVILCVCVCVSVVACVCMYVIILFIYKILLPFKKFISSWWT